ncbi:MAG: hypothetical protein GTN59_15210 [Candidatus Dadabacteria bacterium]|nr:hypothetical protein [Candidatus Dadabacteria bacterium]
MEISQLCERDIEIKVNEFVEEHDENLCFVCTFSMFSDINHFLNTKKTFESMVIDLEKKLDVKYLTVKSENADTIMVTLIGTADDTHRRKNQPLIYKSILYFFKSFVEKTGDSIITAMIDIFENDKEFPVEQYAFGDPDLLESAGLVPTHFNH